ncbi:unnamed protein product, partial [Gulo gulo]
HLARPWAPAVHRTRPSRGPLVGPASRGSRSSLCWPGPQAAAPAGAATGCPHVAGRRQGELPFALAWAGVLASPGVAGFWSGHRDVLRSASVL